MFQPRAKLEFVTRYCNPADGWEVFVDIDPSELGRTGSPRKTRVAVQRQKQMQEDGGAARSALLRLGVTVSGSRKSWFAQLKKRHPSVRLPEVPGNRDVVAINAEHREFIVAEVEGESSGQPEQKLYKAEGQIITAVSTVEPMGFRPRFVVVVYGDTIAKHLRAANALKKIGVCGLAIAPRVEDDEWVVGKSLPQSSRQQRSVGRYAAFKARRGLWLNCFSGEDAHSVMRQINMMIRNAAAYRVVNEARRYASPAQEGGVKLNHMMHRLIDRTFFTSQATAIRRLMDDKNKLEGKRSVYSLASLLDDIIENAVLITREHILEAEGLVYDHDKAKQASFRHGIQHSIQTGNTVCHDEPASADWLVSEDRHSEIDKLCGVTEEDRDRKDAVLADLFGDRKETLKVCDDLLAHVNKFIAHAATPESREVDNADEIRITLAHLWRAHEAICRVAHFIGRYLLTGSRETFLPKPQYNQFAYIDRPLVSQDDIPKLRRIWNEYKREVDEWVFGRVEFGGDTGLIFSDADG